MGKMPPGYRFYPTEEELVSFYLPQQLEGKRTDLNVVIPVVHVYEHEPWDLPKFSGEMCRGDREQWFYFSPRQDRGGRPNRSTSCGYWKATGSPSYVYSSDNRVIGMKKTMVFYKGKAPTGTKSKWKMNEYRAIQQSNQQMSSLVGFTIPKLRHELSLCRVYVVSGSFRAFDRRPVGAEISETSNQQANGGEDVESPQEPQTEENVVGNSSFIYENIQTLSQVTNTNSPETLYSTEYQIEQVLQQQEQQNDLGMDNSVAQAAEHLWDWEQLINWP